MAQNPNLSQPFVYQNAFSPNPNQPPMSSPNPIGGSPYPQQYPPVNPGVSPARMPQTNYGAPEPGLKPAFKGPGSPFPMDHQRQNGPYPSSPYGAAPISEQNMNGAQVNGLGTRPAQNVPAWGQQQRIPVSPVQPMQKLSTGSVGPPNQVSGGLPQSLAIDGNAVPNLSQVPSSSGLPLPPQGSQIVNSSPQVTPGTSQPPSARSSRNPSPISSHRYDYMEGQFSNKPSPTNSTQNIPGLATTPNAGLYPQRNVSDNRQFTSPQPSGGLYPPGGPQFPPNSSPVTPGMGPSPAGPQPAPMRHRYPQQVGYNQATSPYTGPVMNQPNSMQNLTPGYNNSLQPPLNSGYNSSPQPPASGYNSSPQPPTSGYNSSPQPPASGYNSSPQPPASGYNSSPQPPTSGYNSSPQPPASGYNSSQLPPTPGYNSSPLPPTSGYNGSPRVPGMSGYPSSPQPPYPPQQQQYSGGLPEGPVGGVSGYDPQLHAKMAGMSVHNSFSRLWGNDSINLLQDRNILPPLPVEPPKPVLTPDRPNCSPNIFRSTLTKVPDTSSLLSKSRLPFGILIHPFRDASSLSVIQCNTIVRCRNCRTYINPFVSFVDQRRWKCNLCFRVNDLPEEFLYDPSSKSYGDPARRPEIKNATIEFIAPSDYMLRPPQPAVYLFLLDVSHGAIETGYLKTFCDVLLENIDNLPGDSRTRVGFITFDGSIHFYNLGEGLNQPHMLIVSDIEDIFLPSPDNLLVNLHESRALIADLLTDLPKRFSHSGDINSCLGAALQVAYKLMSPVGGRVTVVQTTLPNHGPGALKNREDPNQRAAKDISNIGPANDFYKKLALDCSGQQVAVDLFLLCSQYADIATVSCISKYSSGCVTYYPGYHHELGKLQVSKFAGDLKRYLTRRIGFEAVMRIRCTRGLTIHTFHGNFFVRSTDLLSLPNVNPDTGYGMQIAIEENLTEYHTVCFQAAVLYTSSNGERRIRVHTLCLPVVSILQDVLGGADQETVIGLVSKMAVDRSISSSLSDARDALINVCIDVLGVYKTTVSGQVAGALMSPYSTRLIPLFILALLKHTAFRTGVSTKLDDRVYAMERMKALPLQYLMKYIYPTLYPVHALDDKNAIHQDDDAIIPQPVILQLSSEKIDRHGAYILDTLDVLYLYVGRAVSDHFCTSVLNVPNFSAIPEDLTSLPDLPTPESERMRNFVTWLQDQRPYHSPIKIIREDSQYRHVFMQYMLDDRTESLFSYYEFLQHIRQQISK